jgi:hypothetical protein
VIRLDSDDVITYETVGSRSGTGFWFAEEWVRDPGEDAVKWLCSSMRGAFYGRGGEVLKEVLCLGRSAHSNHETKDHASPV